MKIQKALHMYIEADKKQPKYIGHNYMIFQKYDGWYGYLQDGKIYSGANNWIPSLRHLDMPDLGKTRLIFEILLRDEKEFHILNGILNRKEACHTAYFKVHDALPYLDCKTTFRDRYAYLSEICKRGYYKPLPDSMTIAKPFGISKDPLVWQQAAEHVWSKNGEGVILKRLDAPYEFGKRNANIMKIKEEVTLDLLVIGMDMGKRGGKYFSTLGTLLCVDKSGKKHNISGMSDAQRTEWWRAPTGTQAEPHPIMGRVVEVKAMKILKDGSLREPRFKAIRFDKGPEDID